MNNVTDKEKLTELLNGFGVGFSDDGKIVKLEEGMAKVDGYPRFSADFAFDDDGKFINVSVWE